MARRNWKAHQVSTSKAAKVQVVVLAMDIADHLSTGHVEKGWP
jgi:hypothetical protein